MKKPVHGRLKIDVRIPFDAEQHWGLTLDLPDVALIAKKERTLILGVLVPAFEHIRSLVEQESDVADGDGGESTPKP